MYNRIYLELDTSNEKMNNRQSYLPPAKKSLGQVFLTDADLAYQMVESSGLKSGAQVLEIGPGNGILTQFLLKQGINLTACEIDRRMAEVLKKRFAAETNFRLIVQDILLLQPDDAFPAGDFYIIGNIPYHLTSPILFKCFDYVKTAWDNHCPPRLKTMTIMLQREVADRLLSAPGTKLWGILSIQASLFADIKFLTAVPAEKFHPRPKVDSAVIKLTFRPACPYTVDDYEFFSEILHTVFSRRRKMLRNTLKSFHPPPDLDLDLRKRPEELSAADFARLASRLANNNTIKHRNHLIP